MVAGDVVVGRAVRLACARHLADIEAQATTGLRWEPALAEAALDFFPSLLCLHEGEHAGQPFVLQPWQAFIVGSLFGWVGRDGYRRFRTAYIEIGKGNGKTPMAAGIGLYGLVADDENGAEVYAAAVTQDQARICWGDADKMVSASPSLRGRVQQLQTGLFYAETGSVFRAVSSERRSLDGKRVHMALIDEIHEHADALVVDKLRAGTKGRRQALIVEITNSGFDRETVCWAHHEYSERILEGLEQNDTWFAFVCGLDPCARCRSEGHRMPQDECKACDQWTDERTWPKANPNLGVSIRADYLREQVAEAKGMPSKQNIVKRLNFCIWTQSVDRWLDPAAWAQCAAEVPDAELVGAPCFAGLDLGQTDDLSALALVFRLPDGRYAVRTRVWIPEYALTKFPNRPYDEWRRAGGVMITEGNVSDLDRIEADALELCRRYGVHVLAYDRRFAQQLVQHLEGAGLTCQDVPQGYGLNEALRKLSDAAVKGILAHGGHPVLAHAASVAMVRHGTQKEIRLDKDKSGDKIDPLSALAMAFKVEIEHVEITPMVTAL